MGHLCEHHACEPDPAMARWSATHRGEIIGRFCTDHLADGLDEFDATVTLESLRG